MPARSFADFPAFVHFVKANSAHTESSPLHVTDFFQVNKRASIHKPSLRKLRKCRAPWGHEEIDHVAQVIAKRNQAPIEYVNLHAVGDQRRPSADNHRDAVRTKQPYAAPEYTENDESCVAFHQSRGVEPPET